MHQIYFADDAGTSALDWSGIDVIEPATPRKPSRLGRLTLSVLGILASGLATQEYLTQCL